MLLLLCAFFVLVFSILCYAYCSLGLSVFNFLYCGGGLWSLFGVVDLVSIFVWLMLGLCFYYVLEYTHHYFGGGVAGFDLNKIIVVFVGVMASLVVTGDFLTTLVFWEYLGVVSYFLILFYLSYLSLRSSVITLVSSRFGDVCLFLLIGLCWWGSANEVILCTLFFFVVFTKSASFPFISWLLEAMRAPTPVSSLVHSSTLVAAGVWFMMRYDLLLYSSNGVFIFYLCLLVTIFITGVCCFFFLDLKKIVALSTCNNIAWCVFYILYGDSILALFQLVSHGVSKCLLFMMVGDVMSGSGGSQSSNCVYPSTLYGHWGLFGLYSIVLGLSGVPFIGVFFTKHLLLSGFCSFINFPFFVIVLFCVFLSYFFCFFLCAILTNIKVSLSSGVYFLCGSGAMVYLWLITNYFIGGTLDENFIGFYWITSLLLLFQIVAFVFSYCLYNSVVFTWWSSCLFGSDNLVEYIFNLFCHITSFLSEFYYRWDKEVITIFGGGSGYPLVNVYKNLISLLFASLIVLLSVICILY
uniref:NADH:ubiquinone reductase (H(+)-translocating) n=1 Tax=Spirometra theileri TaxID=2679966 RepID=A0A8E5JUL6_9CEST|nr:NADH dehydrogenase subunit 5 [Spirometra theileri]QVD40125.1 NADH dehydrogenase subunit 5 [Spirometra theileri]